MGASDIRLVGKPHPLIYEACRARLAEAGIPSEGARIAAVGDSLHHDVLGAARNGVDSVFICSGVSTRHGLSNHPDCLPLHSIAAATHSFASSSHSFANSRRDRRCTTWTWACLRPRPCRPRL